MRAALVACTLAVVVGFCARSGADEKEELDKAAKALKSRDAKERLKAVQELAEFGSAALPLLCEAMSDKDVAVAVAASDAIEKGRPDLYKLIRLLVLNKDPDTHAAALSGIGDLGEKARPIQKYLIVRFKREVAAQKSGGKILVESYFQAIKNVGGDADEMYTFYKGVMGDERTSYLREGAFFRLLKLAGDKEEKLKEERLKELLPFLKAHIADKESAEPYIRAAGAFGNVAKDLLPALKKLKLSTNENVSAAAAGAVKRIEGADK